ncbi:TIGR02186 family protein [Poseidonocella sp. HB161398]|uniref:TIGR02186 family protein n=1 Tax=Poseidonocella sp. HB161398 TaxID=2320855 RepID=UPI0011091AD4|nr:TIGR02186 family protein [Poseidonocella sp. HB161398]
MTRLAALLILLVLPSVAGAERVVLGLSQDEVAITATFDGSSILIFGAVQRDAPPPSDQPLDVVIAVEGPKETVTVRKKARRFGIWVNSGAVEIDVAPSFYAVATTRPLDTALSQTEDLRYRISLDRAIQAIGAAEEASDAPSYLEALKRLRIADGRYMIREGAVALDEETLFRTSIRMPANLTVGNYTARIFLTRSGRVVDEYQTVISVHKVGLERWVFSLAQEQPLIYGGLSLIIAIAAGWAASAAFAMLRR